MKISFHIKVIIVIFVSDSGHNYHHTIKEFVRILTNFVPSVPSYLFKIIIGSFFQKGFWSLCQAVAPPVIEITSYHTIKVKQKNYIFATSTVYIKLPHVFVQCNSCLVHTVYFLPFATDFIRKLPCVGDDMNLNPKNYYYSAMSSLC
jgi:ABC-type dipeptide/oligopeptide/nickel transport system permease subunit